MAGALGKVMSGSGCAKAKQVSLFKRFTAVAPFWPVGGHAASNAP